MTLEARKIRLIMELRRRGVTDTVVLSAIERVPRQIFVPETFHDRAYEDTALPIGHGQTISQPSVVAFMTQALQLNGRMKILEVGTGSGYQAAVLARLAAGFTRLSGIVSSCARPRPGSRNCGCATSPRDSSMAMSAGPNRRRSSGSSLPRAPPKSPKL